MTKNVSSLGKVSGLQVSTNPAVLLSITVQNTSASAQYLQLHDSASAPSNGAIPVLSAIVPAGSAAQLEWTASNGRGFDVGIYVCASSTDATKTLGTVDFIIDAQVRGA